MHAYRAFHPREIKLEGKYSESRPALLCTCGEIARDKGRVCRRARACVRISVFPWQRIYSRWHVRVAQPLKTYQSIPLARPLPPPGLYRPLNLQPSTVFPFPTIRLCRDVSDVSRYLSFSFRILPHAVARTIVTMHRKRNSTVPRESVNSI